MSQGAGASESALVAVDSDTDSGSDYDDAVGDARAECSGAAAEQLVACPKCYALVAPVQLESHMSQCSEVQHRDADGAAPSGSLLSAPVGGDCGAAAAAAASVFYTTPVGSGIGGGSVSGSGGIFNSGLARAPCDSFDPTDTGLEHHDDVARSIEARYKMRNADAQRGFCTDLVPDEDKGGVDVLEGCIFSGKA